MELPRKVYAIQHNTTKRIYIGSSKDVRSRYQSHMSLLRNGKHQVEDMQKDFDEHGEDYSLYILDEILDDSENSKEYEWMRKYNTRTRGVGYNYKDRETKTLRFKNFPLRVGEKPEPMRVDRKPHHAKPTESNVRVYVYTKEQYIQKIVDEMRRAADIDLLDFVYLLLEKSCESKEAI